jgi:hypothetical protein
MAGWTSPTGWARCCGIVLKAFEWMRTLGGGGVLGWTSPTGWALCFQELRLPTLAALSSAAGQQLVSAFRSWSCDTCRMGPRP